MGQYYQATMIDQTALGIAIAGWLSAFSYGYGQKLMEHSFMPSNYVSALEYQISPDGNFPDGLNIVWAGDYADPEKVGDETLFHMGTDENCVQFPEHDTSEYRYVVNHTKKSFVDKTTVDEDQLHPLPLLTCEGNGRGGGDYYGRDPQQLVGSWARDLIAVARERPEGYGEVFFDLTTIDYPEPSISESIVK